MLLTDDLESGELIGSEYISKGGDLPPPFKEHVSGFAYLLHVFAYQLRVSELEIAEVSKELSLGRREFSWETTFSKVGCLLI